MNFYTKYWTFFMQLKVLNKLDIVVIIKGQRDGDVYLPSTLVRADIVSLTGPKPAEFMMDTRK